MTSTTDAEFDESCTGYFMPDEDEDRWKVPHKKPEQRINRLTPKRIKGNVGLW